MDLKNRLVSFRILDVYHPEPDELLRSIYGQTILQGRVSQATGTEDGEGFLEVQVKDLPEAVIIPRRAVIGVL